MTESLQKGLLEEEVNRNLPAAAKAYENAVRQTDAQRRVAATALFRLGEVYRKLGRTNEAAAQYQRVLLDFADETNLVGLARQHLISWGAGFGAAGGDPDFHRAALDREVAAQTAELLRLTALRTRLARLPSAELAQVLSSAVPDAQLTRLLEQRAKQQQELAALRTQTTDEHPKVKETQALQKQVDQQIDERAGAILSGLEAKADALKLSLDALGVARANASSSTGTGAPGGAPAASTFQARLLAAQVGRVKELKDDPEQQAHAVLAFYPDEGLRRMLAHLPKLRELAAFARTNESATAIPFLTPVDAEGRGGTEPGTVELVPRQPAPMIETQVALQLQNIAQRVDFIMKTQQARLLALETEAGLSATELPGAALTPAAQRQKALLEQEVALVEEQLKTKQLLFQSGRISRDELLVLQREALSLKRQMAALESQVRRDLLDLPLTGAEANAASGAHVPAGIAPTVDPADADSLREEIKLVEQELQSARKKLENGKAEEAEVRRAQRELLRLQRRLPENAAGDRQIALLEEELKLTETGLAEIRKKIEVGAAPPLDEVPVRRELLGVQRELAAAKRDAAPPERSDGPDHRNTATEGGSAPATSEETSEIQRIQAIIKNSPDLVNARNATPKGGTPLHKAAASGYLAVAEYLLNNGADVSALDSGRESPLHLAAAAGHKRVCELLLAKGADVKATDYKGFTPLHLAVSSGYVGVAETLFAAGAEANTKANPGGATTPQPDWDSTPLHSAAEQGFTPLIELLLKNGADINATDRGGRTPLVRAIPSRHANAVRLLLEKGADPNLLDAEGQSPLFWAVAAKQESLVRLLLDHKANVNARIAAPEPDGEWTVLFRTVWDGEVGLTRLLLDAGAEINGRAASGITPVHQAVLKNTPATLSLLVERKADVNVRDSANSTPLHYALAQGAAFAPIIDALLDAGADANAAGWTAGWPPLAFVATPDAGGFPSAVAASLLKHGAEVNAAMTNGWTPLHQAVRHGRADLAELFVARGARINARGSFPAMQPVPADRRPVIPSSAASPEAAAGRSHPPTRNLRTAAAAGGMQPRGPVTLSAPRGAPLPAPGVFPVPGVPGMPDMSRVVTDKDVTPLHVAVAHLNLELARFLLEHGAEVNARDAEGHTPLHVAVSRRDLDLMRLLLDAKADPDLSDSSGRTPLVLASSILDSTQFYQASQAPNGRTVTMAKPNEIIALLRERGAKTVLSDPNAITVARASTGYSAKVLTRGKRDWNRFSLLELLAIHYGLLAQSGAQNAGPKPILPATVRAPSDPLAFPDLARIRITRPLPGGGEKLVPADLGGVVKAGNCAADVWLEWGDIVEIPEEDHPLNQGWTLPHDLRSAFKRCLERTVQIQVKGEDKAFELQLPFRLGPDGERWVDEHGQPLAGDDRAQRLGWDLRTTVDRSGFLRTSSDRSRVRVIRVLAATGARQEWLVDCSAAYEEPGLWLRDGDRIEVPDKVDQADTRAPGDAGATGVARVLGEVKRPGTVALKLGERRDIIDAIAECGGLTDRARPQVEFTRDGVTRKFTLDELKAETDPTRKIWLAPGDTLEVKERTL